jgi:hypothetical protein
MLAMKNRREMVTLRQQFDWVLARDRGRTRAITGYREKTRPAALLLS